jgi:NADH-quinone oxidoreductase subunit N
MNYLELLKLAAPQTVLVVAALAVLAVDLLAVRELELRFRQIICAMVACAGCILAIAWMVALPAHANILQGILVVDSSRQWVMGALLVLALFTALITIDTSFTDHVGEYFALILLATVGMLFLVSTEDILMIFISLELTSLSLYILTAFNKRNIKSAEAALKYFLFGGMSAAFTLFGLSLLYGLSGSTNLSQIAAAIKLPGLDPLLVLAIVMTVIGFGFKVAAVPFHLWAPDAYEGAPTPSAALIASGSKVASFFIFAKVMMIGFAGAEGSGAMRHFGQGWVPVIAVVAALSMVLGNFAAIVQVSVRRLLAYSAIAHAGYMLVAILAHSQIGLSALMYYAVTYGLTTLGAFGVVSVVQQQTGSDRLADFAGLSRRAPVLSFCMLVFMLSLAGIPPLAGFFGKFYVFSSAIGDSSQLGMLWLVILAIAMSAVSLYYYLQVLKQIYVSQAPAEAPTAVLPVLSQAVLAVVALAVVVLGVFPDLLVGQFVTAMKIAGL